MIRARLRQATEIAATLALVVVAIPLSVAVGVVGSVVRSHRLTPRLTNWNDKCASCGRLRYLHDEGSPTPIPCPAFVDLPSDKQRAEAR